MEDEPRVVVVALRQAKPAAGSTDHTVTASSILVINRIVPRTLLPSFYVKVTEVVYSNDHPCDSCKPNTPANECLSALNLIFWNSHQNPVARSLGLIPWRSKPSRACSPRYE